MRLKRIQLITVLLTSLAAVSCEDTTTVNTSSSEEFLSRATSYYEQGQFNVSIIEIKNALQKNADNIDAYNLLAKVYYEQGNHLQSIKILEGITNKNPETLIILIKNHLALGKAKSAQAILDAKNNQPLLADNIEIQILEAKTHVLLYQNTAAESALKSLHKAKLDNATQARIKIITAMLYAQTDKVALAETTLKEALTLDPKNVDALTQLSDIKFQQEAFEDAEDLLSQALFNLPTTDTMTLKKLQVLKGLVSILTRLGRASEAIIYSKLIADANPKLQEIETQYQEAIDLLKAGKMDEAEAILSQLNADSASYTSGSLLGLIKYSQGDYQSASELFGKFIDPEIASEQALTVYAETELRLKKPTEALTVIESSINAGSKDPRLLSVYGLSLLATGQDTKGVEVIKSVLALDPERTRLRLALAKHYNKTKEYDSALIQLEAAYKTSPNDNAIQEMLLRQYHQAKKEERFNQLIEELANKPSPDSRALAGLALTKTNPKRASGLINQAYLDQPDSQRTLTAKLTNDIAHKHYADAIKTAKKALKTNGNNVYALSAIGISYGQQQQAAKAEAFFLKLANQSVNNWAADYVLSRFHFGQSHLEKAANHAELAMTKSSFNQLTTNFAVTVYKAQATQAMQTGNTTEAKAALVEALQISPNDIALIHLMLLAELKDDNIKKANELAQQISDAAPNSFLLHLSHGEIEKAQDNRPLAYKHLIEAWKMKKSDPLGYTIWNLIDNSVPTSRTTFLSEWKKSIPNSPRTLFIEGIQFQQDKDFAKAKNAYEQSLVINPNQPAILNNLAWIEFDQGKLETALTHATKAYNLSPNDAAVLDTLGWITFKNGNKDKAKKLLAKALKLAPDDEEIKQHYEKVSL